VGESTGSITYGYDAYHGSIGAIDKKTILDFIRDWFHQVVFDDHVFPTHSVVGTKKNKYVPSQKNNLI